MNFYVFIRVFRVCPWRNFSYFLMGAKIFSLAKGSKLEKTLQTDEQLITSYQQGDVESFEILYQRHKNALYRYFYRQLQNSAIADELHQDVWMKIIKSSSPFNHQSLFTTWIFKIAHHRLIDYYRHNKNQVLQIVDEQLSLEVGMDVESGQNEGANQSLQPDKLVEQKQMHKQIILAVDSLPSEQKETFLLYELSGLSLKEIAKITEVSFENSKSRLRYALKKLRLQLRDLL